MRRCWASRWAARPLLAACGAQPTPAPAAAAPTAVPVAAATAVPPTAVAVATAAPKAAAGPLRGGTLTIASRVQRIDHPARLSWIEGVNQWRQVCEYLTYTGPDNITVPWLLDKWSGRRRPQDLDAQPQEGHQVQRRPGVDRRRRGVQPPAVARPGGWLLDARADELPQADRHREGGRLHRQAQPRRGRARRAGASVPLPGDDRAQDLRGRHHQAAHRHRPIPDGQVRGDGACRTCRSQGLLSERCGRQAVALPRQADLPRPGAGQRGPGRGVAQRPGGRHLQPVGRDLAGGQGRARDRGLLGRHRPDLRDPHAGRCQAVGRRQGAPGAQEVPRPPEDAGSGLVRRGRAGDRCPRRAGASGVLPEGHPGRTIRKVPRSCSPRRATPTAWKSS